MKLKKFKQKDNKRIWIIVFTIMCILLVSGVILYRTFAIFEVKKNQNIIKGTVQDPGNLYFAFFKDNEIQKDIPKKDEGYVLDEESSYCGINGSNEDNIKVTLTEDYVIQVHGVTTSRTKCNLYFVKGKFIQGKGIPIVEEGDGLYEVIHNHDETTNLDIEWQKNEYRYAGINSKNYVWFNDELWRIIGLVNVKTKNDIVEQRLKIIKNNQNDGEQVWDANNQNDWTKATLQYYLNTEYYSNQLKDSVKSMISEDIIWNIGGIKWDDYQSSFVNQWYEKEREKFAYNNQPYEWDNSNLEFHSIGLMYPSDYGYAVGGENRSSCLKREFIYYNEDCYKDDWLFFKDNSGTSHYQWTISPYGTFYNGAFSVVSDGSIGYNAVTKTAYVRPTIYLKTNVKIINDEQDGSEEYPYHLQQIL